ncbi:TRAP transporter substrate-binding protein DctP [Roseibium aggregatum]|uniref:TRAP transporter substrate-binding protein DctP n=1 Tax=Roseibium aggregatum TaxID=187304 RepID=A0A939ECC5_9HYPH|nr:TRAP transporter substrate-binding protein DctP [Roseibium aggregatum]MBN9669473.1 TRAP transporter substrate-binding protein DctP [Roseibium aggregatum]
MRTIVSLLAGAAMFAGSTLASQAADLTLRISLQTPLKSHLGQNLLLFKDEVEKKSGGDIEVQIYDSAQLFKDSEVPEAVGSGALEMGVASLTRYVGDIPAVDIFYMPFVLNSEEKIRKAVAPGSPVRQPLDDAILETGARVLWWQAYGTVILISKGEPIAKPADMADKKARVFGKSLGTWVSVVGGVPTMISGSEQFLAYQRGTVDLGMTGVSGVQSRKLWEVMDTITKTNHADIEFLVVINEDFWQGLTDEQRGWISEAARVAEIDVRDRVAEIEAKAYSDAEENGMTIYQPTDEEIAAWKEASAPVIDTWLEEAGPLGKQVLDAANGL